MTASRTGLAILAAVAVVLAVLQLALGRGGPAASGPPFADVVPGPGPHTLVWDRPDRPMTIAGSEAAGWTMTAPAPGPIEPAAIADVIGALRAARWQRRDTAGHGPARFTLRLDGDTLEIGQDLPEVGAWIRRGATSYLVERWVIAAIDPDPLAVRVRSPFARVLGGLRRIEVRGTGAAVVMRGPPLAIEVDGAPVALRQDIADAVLEHLAWIRVESLPAVAAGDRPELGRIVVESATATAEVIVRGPCPAGLDDRLWVGGDATGEVCVAAEPVIALQVAAATIARDPIAVADPRPVVAPITDLTLASGAHVVWHGAAIELAGDAPVAADADAVARVVDALTADAVVVRTPNPRPAPTGAVVVGGDSIELLGGDLLSRPGSPIAYRVERSAIAALRQDRAALRDRLLWRAEPSLLTGLTVTEAGATRSVPIDDAWARAVADALATPHAVAFVASAGPVGRRIELTFAPPPTAGAAPEIRRIELGRARAGGCAAIADGTPVVLAADLCKLLAR